MAKKRVLNSTLIHNFTEKLLLRNYDEPVDIPRFHDEVWALCCSDYPFVAVAAPRGHAKSTAVTHAYVLANLLFRVKKNILIVSNTEEQAIGFLSGIKEELAHNELVRELFGLKTATSSSSHTEEVVFEKFAEKQVVVNFEDGSWGRVVVKGSKQRMRGVNYRNTRPDLIICDDIEDDETCRNDELRREFKQWVLKVLIPARSKSGHIRVVGTILHTDSFLMNTMESRAWRSKLYRAHAGYNDFSEILWEEQWPQESLLYERDMYEAQGEAYIYSQEYLNNPLDMPNMFFKESDLLPMEEEDYSKPKVFYCGYDSAISEKTRADYNVWSVGGYDSDGILHIVDHVRERGLNGEEIIDELFRLDTKHMMDMFIIEKTQITQALEGTLLKEMDRRRQSFDYEMLTPVQDKEGRARPLQKLIKSGLVKFDTNAEWWPELKKELLEFPYGKKDDQVDALSWLARGIYMLAEAPTRKEMEQQEFDREYMRELEIESGINESTGY